MDSGVQQYANPDVLVETEWVEKNLNNASLRIVEVDYDRAANYDTGHIPGAVLFDWRNDLNHPVTRDIPSKEQLENLFSRSGISNDTTIALYGDFNNWFATFAFWIFKYYGIENVKMINGGRKKWLLEDRPLSKDVPGYPRTDFRASQPDETLRVYMDYVRQAIRMKDKILVDVRSPKEYKGEILAPPEYPSEQAQRGGHIPGAKNIPWSQAVNDTDGTFKPKKELEKLYVSKGVTPEKEVITYCRIGERSSHTWFVLKYLLGYLNVKNYDGSWSEWGSSVRAPVEK
ncbi:MAG: sulfurtransferase [Candidatus Methanoperedens sp.]|nr:sulfurtransferase [Candidatus Methanoperedens sp.]